MSRRRDWDKAKSDKLKGMPSEPADVDMRHEPEHQAWWRRKTREQRTDSKKSLQKQMAEAFSRGRPAGVERPKEVVAALISPKIRALLEELAAKTRRREQTGRRIQQGLSKTQAERNKPKR